MDEYLEGKHFSITDPQNVNTVIYRINETDKKLLDQYPKYTAERLVFSEELHGEMKKKTFFIDNPQPDGENLLILSFGGEKVVVNMGLMQGNKIRISRRPIPVKFDTLYSEQTQEYKNFNYTPNLQRPISIIDPETAEEVKPILYFDEETNEVKGKCKLKPYKSYFAFEIRDKKN